MRRRRCRFRRLRRRSFEITVSIVFERKFNEDHRLRYFAQPADDADDEIRTLRRSFIVILGGLGNTGYFAPCFRRHSWDWCDSWTTVEGGQ
jgi:hypothetical protein